MKWKKRKFRGRKFNFIAISYFFVKENLRNIKMTNVEEEKCQKSQKSFRYICWEIWKNEECLFHNWQQNIRCFSFYVYKDEAKFAVIE